ncbi:predicted protein [Nematostella vectensis]|uniref:Uncharacterized protein n=1 Tax=Nematostella vectensis TaxID=45351 RepID=A7SZ59_NEMVE|nr:protein CFAP107 [Nematostella vectensis]EDO31004.1 predicted protein [Nematostella vectensis]|eukprot:XP_001623104.1 predicted protein [Nematostella vectensis]
MFNPERYDDIKWGLPGWRIEQRYATDVLIGNWNEERRNFERGGSHFNSTQKTDFKNYGKQLPDVKTRRQALLKHDGLAKAYLFSHHGKTYSGHRISWYDQEYNKREVTESQLPPLRSWNSQQLAWGPEKSDFPLEGRPTNYGLLEKKQEKWRREAEAENMSIYHTTKELSYVPHARKAFTYRHHATPRFISSHFHPHRVNKDLHLRSKPYNTACEYPPLLASATI